MSKRHVATDEPLSLPGFEPAEPPRPVAREKPKVPFVTWLTPYYELWERVVGSPPIGVAGTLAKMVTQLLEAGYEEPTVLAHLERYLRETPVAYLNLSKWAATFAAWAPAQRGATRGSDSMEMLPGEDIDGYIGRLYRATSR